MIYRYIESPIGRLLLAGDHNGLKIIGFPQGKGRVAVEAGWVLERDCFDAAESQLAEYFDGRRRLFRSETRAPAQGSMGQVQWDTHSTIIA